MTDEDNMAHALSLARAAGEAGEVPVGALVLGPEGEVLGDGDLWGMDWFVAGVSGQ